MKLRKLIYATCLYMSTFLSVASFANDTSFPTIEVDKISTNIVDLDSPTPEINSYITFSGNESLKLMQVLPPVESVLGKDADRHFRNLDILSQEYTVSIRCRDSVDRAGKVSTIPHCEIRIASGRFSPSPTTFKPDLQCHAK